MAPKVVDLDPTKRLTREGFEALQKRVANLSMEEVESLTVITKLKGANAELELYGITWEILGIVQAYMEQIRWELLDDGTIEND